MDSFEHIYRFVRNFEGGLSNHKSDRGGLTYAGVSKRAWPNWKGWVYIEQNKLPPEKLVKDFYYKLWIRNIPTGLPDPIKMVLFDASVMSGGFYAKLMLQKALNALGHSVVLDGFIGPETEAAIQKAVKEGKLDKLLESFCQERIMFYEYIVDRNPSQVVFLKGWKRRAYACLDYVQGYANRKGDKDIGSQET